MYWLNYMASTLPRQEIVTGSLEIYHYDSWHDSIWWTKNRNFSHSVNTSAPMNPGHISSWDNRQRGEDTVDRASCLVKCMELKCFMLTTLSCIFIMLTVQGKMWVPSFFPVSYGLLQNETLPWILVDFSWWLSPLECFDQPLRYLIFLWQSQPSFHVVGPPWSREKVLYSTQSLMQRPGVHMSIVFSSLTLESLIYSKIRHHQFQFPKTRGIQEKSCKCIEERWKMLDWSRRHVLIEQLLNLLCRKTGCSLSSETLWAPDPLNAVLRWHGICWPLGSSYLTVEGLPRLAPWASYNPASLPGVFRYLTPVFSGQSPSWQAFR